MVVRALEVLRHSGNMLLPHMPFWDTYTRKEFIRDLIAAATVAAVLVPQSIAYALLAGLPPAHGLYAALIGGIAGALWGSSRHLATGPIALVSLLTLTAIAPLAEPGSAQYIALAAALALMVGVVQLIFGLSRLGFLVRLVPLSVLTAFSSGAALVIIITQIPHLLGFSISQGSLVFQQLAHIITDLDKINLYTVIVGASAFLILMILRGLSKKIPGTLVVLVGGIAASYMFDLGSLGVRLAGDIPARLPITDIPSLSIPILFSLGGNALVIALVGFMSSYAVVKELSTKTKERISSDQELIGQGFANLFAGLFRGLPVGGSLSRTAVNYEAGAKTAWSGVYASIIMAVVILTVSSILSYLPNAVLAAIVIVAVVPLVDIKKLQRMYEITRTDGIIAVVTFSSVFFLPPEQAVLLGVVLALILYMRKVMWVNVVEVGFHPEWRSLVSRLTYPEAETYPQMLMLRIDAPIFYANVERLSLEIQERIGEHRAEHDQLQVVALDFSGVNHMDVTGVDGMTDIVDDLREHGIKVYVTTPRREIREVLERGLLGDAVRFVHGTRELRLIGEQLVADSRTLVA